MRPSVALAEIDRERERGWINFHPEDYCHRCGGRNRSWFVDSDRFNAAFGHPDDHPHNGIVCVGCFIEAHEAATGLRSSWKLIPDTPFRPIEEDPLNPTHQPNTPPTTTPNPCALEDVPHGAEWAAGDTDKHWHSGPGRGGAGISRRAVWWRWPEPKGLTFPDDPWNAATAQGSRGKTGVALWASRVQPATAGLLLVGEDSGQSSGAFLTPAELRSLRDRCDTVLAHLEGRS